MDKHPDQYLTQDTEGVVRFTENKIVRFLLDNGGYDLNYIVGEVCKGEFDKEDYVQFNQLIGYSLSGWGDIDQVTDEDYEQASEKIKTADEFNQLLKSYRILAASDKDYLDFIRVKNLLIEYSNKE